MSVDAPRVTVVGVSYNHAPYLEHCLQSLLDQTIEPHIMVVDDFSTDASRPIIRDFVRRSGRPDLFTLLLHQEMELKQLGRRPDLTGELAARLRVRAIRLYRMRGNNELAARALAAALKAAGRVDPAGIFYWSLAKVAATWTRPHARATPASEADRDEGGR